MKIKFAKRTLTKYPGQPCAKTGIQTIGESDDRDEGARQARAAQRVHVLHLSIPPNPVCI
jgi:hypothetical protein